MNKKITKYIYVFGSEKKFLKLSKYLEKTGIKAFFISGISSSNPELSKTKNEIVKDFCSFYNKKQNVIALISFAKGSVLNNIKEISDSFEEIKNKYLKGKHTQFIGPSKKASKIFCDKYLTYKTLSKLGIPVPKTIKVSNLDIHTFKEIKNKVLGYPLVIKARNLSGGRGIKYIQNEKELKLAINKLIFIGINDAIFSEYISGVEATFTVFRLGETFMRMPTSYKRSTSKKMIHPDSKVKFCGIFNEFEVYFEYVEMIMKMYEIYGFFSLQGILIKNKNKNYNFKVLEAAPRMTGSTPIMEASLKNFNIFETLIRWLDKNELYYAYEKIPAIQYSSYIHNGLNTIEKLKKIDWIIETKYEDLSKLCYSEDNRKRIRISFFVNNFNEIQEKTDIISKICKNKNYGHQILSDLEWFKKYHPNIEKNSPQKVLEGKWSSDTKWEFFLSSFLPSNNLSSAVFGLPKTKKGIMLTKTNRGWELPGGHIEKNENLEKALKREILEEAGFLVQRATLIGFRKITTKVQIYDKNNDPYPYPISFIPHFIVSSDKNKVQYTGKEVLDCVEFKTTKKILPTSHVEKIIDICILQLNRI